MGALLRNRRSNSRGRAVLALILGGILLSSVLGLLAGYYDTYLVGVVVAVAVLGFGVAIHRPYLVLVALVLSAFSVDYLQFVLNLPKFVSYVQDLLILILLAFGLGTLMTAEKRRFSLWSILWATILLSLVMTLSALLNGTPLSVAAAGLRYYLKYPILFMAVVILDFPKKQQRLILYLILGLLLAQIPIVILQHLSILPGAAVLGSGSEDAAGGTIGVNTTGILTVFCVGIAGIMLGQFVFDRPRIRYVILAALLMIAPVVAEGKAAIVLLPATIGLIVILKAIYGTAGSWWRITFITLVALGLAWSVMLTMRTFGISSTVADTFSSHNAFLAYLTEAGGDWQFARLGRLGDLSVTMQLLTSSLPSLLLGFGPGTMSGTGLTLGVPAAVAWFAGQGLGEMQITVLLLEVGALGVVAYLLLPAIVATGILRSAHGSADPTLWLRATSLAIASAIYVVGMFYSQPWWSAALSVAFWTFAAFTCNAAHQQLPKPEIVNSFADSVTKTELRPSTCQVENPQLQRI
jgi:hypothetical protein